MRLTVQNRTICLALATVAALTIIVGCRRQAPPSGRCPPPPVFVLPDPATSPLTVWRPVAGRKIILDAGHGGKDVGAHHFDVREKDVNLDLALRTAALLRARGAIVLFTRDTDVFVPLPGRSEFANRHPDAVFVSIHVNAVDKAPNAEGVETFVLAPKLTDEERGRTAGEKFRMDGTDSEYGRRRLAELTTTSRGRATRLAASMQKSLVARLGERDRGVKTGNLSVLRETYLCPAVLVEVGFVSNARTAELMKTEDWRRRTAEALFEGIVEFLRQPDKGN